MHHAVNGPLSQKLASMTAARAVFAWTIRVWPLVFQTSQR